MLVEHDGIIRCATITEGNRYVISGSADEKLLVWNLSTGAVEHQLIGHTDEVMTVKSTSDGTVAISGQCTGRPTESGSIYRN